MEEDRISYDLVSKEILDFSDEGDIVEDEDETFETEEEPPIETLFPDDIFFSGNPLDDPDWFLVEDFQDDNQCLHEKPHQPKTSCSHKERFCKVQRNINIVYFMKSRNIGKNFSRTRKLNTFLSFSLMIRWSAVSQVEMLYDAKALVRRRIYPWEGNVLVFLQKNALKIMPSETGLKKEALLHISEDSLGIVPIAFNEIVQNLIEGGADLNWRDENGNDLLLYLIQMNQLHEDSIDFFKFLIKQGYDIKETGDEAIRDICFSCMNSVSYAKVRMIKLLFDAGLELKDETKQKLIPLFIWDSLHRVNRNALAILMLLLQHGCRANNALLTMELLKPVNTYEAPGYFDCILEIAKILIYNGGRVTSELWMPRYVYRMLELANHENKHPSMLGFLEECARGGYNIKSTLRNGMNLLMAFCAQYKCCDLPDVIRFLCQNGIDVNQHDELKRNALFHLAGNASFFEKSVLDAIFVLVEFGIDVRHTDSFDCTALTRFLSIEISAQCCYYQGLLCLNGSYYWAILNLFLDAGFGVKPQEDSSDILQRFLSKFTELKYQCSGICKSCLSNYSRSISDNGSLADLDTYLFTEAFKFIERLVKAGARINSLFLDEFENALHCVCFFFQGEQLVLLVKLLCENGVDVNATANTFLGKDPFKRMDAIEILRKFNSDQAHLINRLIEIMKPYGYQTDW